MKGLKTTAIILLAIGTALCFIPIIFYICNFSGRQLSDDPSGWGTFGDFIGGTINPIIGLLNLGLLLAISIYVSKFDSHRQFNDYRYQVYHNLCKEFDASRPSSEDLSKLKNYAEVFKFNNQFLFPSESNIVFNDLMEKLIKNTEILKTVTEIYEENVQSGEIKVMPIPRSLGRELEEAFKDWPKTETEESLALKKFSGSKKNIIGFIQTVMIDGNINSYKQNIE